MGCWEPEPGSSFTGGSWPSWVSWASASSCVWLRESVTAVGSSSFSPGEECTGLDCEVIAGDDRWYGERDHGKNRDPFSARTRSEQHMSSRRATKERRPRVSLSRGNSRVPLARSGTSECGSVSSVPNVSSRQNTATGSMHEGEKKSAIHRKHWRCVSVSCKGNKK